MSPKCRRKRARKSGEHNEEVLKDSAQRERNRRLARGGASLNQPSLPEVASETSERSAAAVEAAQPGDSIKGGV